MVKLVKEFSTAIAYREAAELDRQIDKLLRDYPPELLENVPGYQILLRTVRSGLNIIEKTLPPAAPKRRFTD